MGVFLEGFIFILIIGFTHLLCMSVQAISGSHYFYGVYINQIEIDKDTRKNIDKAFKKKLNINLIITIAIYILLNLIPSTNFGINIGITATIYIATYLVILKNIYNQVKDIKYKYIDEHGISTPTNSKKQLLKEDEELSKAKVKIKKKFKILFGICIAISLLSFIYVLINYKNMPDVIITHWGAGGKPDGYSEKNIIDAFFTNVIDILMVVMFAIIGVGTVSTPVYIDAQNIEVNRKKAIKYLNGIGYSFFLLTLTVQSMTSLIPVFMVNQSDVPMSLMLFGCIAPIFISVVMIYYYIMLGSLKPKDKSLYTIESNDENWIYGFIYYNKEDPSLMVEKRLGAGWGMNMAHPLGKVLGIIIAGTLILPLAMCFI
ncbi:MAG: DUF5808 domain-containing protein [Paraclostridium sp.]